MTPGFVRRFGRSIVVLLSAATLTSASSGFVRAQTTIENAQREELPTANEIELSLSSVPDRPFPFQAVRLVCTLVNKSQRTVGPTVDWTEVGNGVRIEHVSKSRTVPLHPHGLGWFQDPYRGTLMSDDPNRSMLGSVGRPCRHFLPPQTFLRLTLPLGGTFAKEAEFAPPHIEPLWGRPGETEEIRVSYPLAGKKAAVSTLRITVAEPQGDDLEPYRYLLAHPDLIRFMGPIDSPSSEEHAEALKAFCDRFPKSGYADYARLVLARRALSETRRRPQPGAVAEPKVVAGKYLLEITSLKFPYRPEATLMFAAMEKRAEVIEGLKKELCESHRDSLEVLREYRRKHDEENWNGFRVRSVKFIDVDRR
jgi:hypothetical protein